MPELLENTEAQSSIDSEPNLEVVGGDIYERPVDVSDKPEVEQARNLLEEFRRKFEKLAVEAAGVDSETRETTGFASDIADRAHREADYLKQRLEMSAAYAFELLNGDSIAEASEELQRRLDDISASIQKREEQIQEHEVNERVDDAREDVEEVIDESEAARRIVEGSKQTVEPHPQEGALTGVVDSKNEKPESNELRRALAEKELQDQDTLRSIKDIQSRLFRPVISTRGGVDRDPNGRRKQQQAGESAKNQAQSLGDKFEVMRAGGTDKLNQKARQQADVVLSKLAELTAPYKSGGDRLDYIKSVLPNKEGEQLARQIEAIKSNFDGLPRDLVKGEYITPETIDRLERTAQQLDDLDTLLKSLDRDVKDARYDSDAWAADRKLVSRINARYVKRHR